MSSLKLYGSTSGYVEIVPEATAGNNSVTLPNTVGSIAVKDASGNLEVGTGVTIAAPSSNTFTVSTNGSERVRVDSSGNVNIDSNTLYVDAVNNRLGIGTTSVQAKFHVSNAGAEGVEIEPGGISGANLTRHYNRSTSAYINNNIYALNSIFHAGTSEVGRWDSSGRLLVGTSSARSNFFNTSFATQLQLEGISSASSSSAFISNFNGTGGEAYCVFAKSRGSTVGSNTVVQSSDILGTVAFQGSDGTQFVDGAHIRCEVDGTPGANDMPGRLVFSTTADGASSPTERMRIGQSGNVSIGTTGSEGRITIVGDNCGGYIGAITNQNNSNCNPAHGLIFRAGQNTSSSGSNFFSFRRPDDTVLGSISQNGASSVAYNTSSDYRLKENITPLTGALDRINQLKPSQFNFITEPGKTVDGFIAHEAQEVVPECVTGDKDAVDDEGNPIYQGIDQSKLVPLLTAALQEAFAEIESLKARVTALEP